MRSTKSSSSAPSSKKRAYMDVEPAGAKMKLLLLICVLADDVLYVLS